MGSRIARWLGWEDDDVLSGERKRKKKRKIVDDIGVRTRFKRDEVIYCGSKRRYRDPSLPSFCTNDFTGKVKIRGKTVKFIDGVRQKR